MISFARPTISKQDLKHVLEAMLSDRLENGELSKKLARELAEFVGAQNLLVFNSKEIGLFLVLTHLGLSAGDEVIVPAYGDPFILEVLSFLKLTPRFVDLKEGSYAIDLEKAEKVIGEKTKVLIVSHLFGYPVDIPSQILEREGLTVIEDATHALGSRLGDQHLGLKGNFGLFSLDSESLITTAQGGFVVCRLRKDMEALRDKRSIRNPESIGGRLGVSLSDLQSALGLSELSLAGKFLSRRAEIGKYYRESVKRGTNHYVESQDGKVTQDLWFPVQAASSLKSVLEFFKKYKIEAIEPFPKCLFEYVGLSDGEFPNARKTRLKTFCVPLYPVLSREAIEETGKLLANVR